jgi:multiple sugar transport system substrate-binding protein
MFLGYVIAVPCALGLAACAAPAPNSTSVAPTPLPSNQTVSVRFDSYNYGAPGIGGHGIQQLLDEFTAANPNIQIQARNVPAPDIVKSTVAQAAAGDPPEIAQLVLNQIEYVVANLPVQALDQIAPADEYSETMKHILPQALKLGQVKGRQYGSPFTFSTPTLFYNADIFRAAGLDPATPPTNWQMAEEYGRQIKARTDKAALYPSMLSPGNDLMLQSFFQTNGGGTLSDDKTSATFNAAPAIEVYQFFQRLYADGIIPKLNVQNNDAEAISLFSNNNLAMLLTSTVLLGAFKDAANGKWELRAGGEPGFGDKPAVPVNTGSALFVLTKDPVKQHAAWEFLRFAASQRGNTIITSLMGYVPQRDDVVDDPNYLKPYLAQEPRMLPAIHQLGYLQPWLSWPGSNAPQALDVFMTASQNVIIDGQPAQPTMDAAARRVDDLLKAG